jgi:hypothetical protein
MTRTRVSCRPRTYYDMYTSSCADIYTQKSTANSPPYALRLSLALRLNIGISVQLRKPGQGKRLT